MDRNVTATILIILAIGIYFTVTQSLVDGVRQVQAVNTQYTSAISSADQLIKVRDQVLKDYNNLSADNRQRLDRMLPSTVDNIRLIIDLNSIARQHGFSLKNIKAAASSNKSASAPQPSTGTSQNLPGGQGSTVIPTPTLDTVNVSFSVTAPYQQFIIFLQDLETNLRLMDVTHLSVAANDTGIYDFSVDLKTYWLRQQ